MGAQLTLGLSLAELARDYAQSPVRWSVTPRFDPVRRWYARLAVADRYEAWLLTWAPGQGTDLHDHGGSAGAFLVVTGQLTEEVLDLAAYPTLQRQIHDAGRGAEFGGHHVHRLTNQGDEPALSVHVYAPRLTIMTRYVLESTGVRVLAVDREGETW